MTGGPEADARGAEVDQKGRDSGDTTSAMPHDPETGGPEADDPDRADATAEDDPDAEPDAEKPPTDAEPDAEKPPTDAHAEPEAERDAEPDAEKPPTDAPEPEAERDAEPDAEPKAEPDPAWDADKPPTHTHTEPIAESEAERPATDARTFDIDTVDAGDTVYTPSDDTDGEPRTTPAGSGDTAQGASAEPAAWQEAGAGRPSAGPRFTPPPFDPSAVAPASAPSVPDTPDEPFPVPPPDEPFPAPVAAPAAVPRQYTTGSIPIVEIEGGWDAVYRRRRRQTVTFLGGLALVLVVGSIAWLTYAGVVPWPFGGAVKVAQSVCTRSQPLPPKKIAVRVFNGSARNGLASQVSAQLKALGFAVKVTGNDPLEARIKTPVQIRHGANGDIAAATMSAYVVGKVDQEQDDRQDATIDLVLGPSYSRLHTKSELKKSLAAVTATLPLTCPAGVTPTPTPTPSGTPKARVTPRPTASPKR
jgi:LytR cell envelope-related transcriptional attenuator